MSAVQAIREQHNPWPFTLERVTGTLGAEISDIDLSRPLTPETVAAISDALVEYKVLFFRDQNITPEQQIAFGSLFGPLEQHPFTGPLDPDRDPRIFRLHNDAEQRQLADSWHSDVTWRQEPSLGSILCCRVPPAFGGDTMWADMEAAYDGLDDATRSRISGLTAIHDWEVFRRLLRARGIDEARIEALNAEYPLAEHPVVRTHPVSGRKGIYVNNNFTIGIKGMAESESGPLLQHLYDQAGVPEYQVRFRWRKNSIAFWDNRSTQHRAVADFFPQTRTMERVTVAGTRPF